MTTFIRFRGWLLALLLFGSISGLDAQTALPGVATDVSQSTTNNQFGRSLQAQTNDQYLFYINQDNSNGPDIVVYDLAGAQVDSIIPGNNLNLPGALVRDTLYLSMAQEAGVVNRQVQWVFPGAADQAYTAEYGVNPWIYGAHYTLVGDQIFFAGKNPNSSNLGRMKLLRMGVPRDTSTLEIASDLHINQHEFNGGNFPNLLDVAITPIGPTGSEYALYRGSDGSSGYEYFVYDLSTNSASLLQDISATGDGAYATGLAGVGNLLAAPVVLSSGSAVFPAFSDTSGVELWVTDGTTGGTGQILNLNPSGGITIPTTGMVSLGSTVLFAADTGAGLDLWSTDGTAAGTALVLDIQTGLDDSIRNMAVNSALGLACFSADNGTDGSEPWISDGTTVGTMMLTDLNPTGASNPRFITATADGFIFVADNGTEARLYFTDGTMANTVQLDNRTSYTAYAETEKFLVASDLNVYFADTAGMIFQVAYPAGPNQAPTLADGSYLIPDTTSGGSIIDTLTALDPEGDMLSYSILNGNADGNFVLDASSGELSITASPTFDPMTTPSYLLEVEVSDGTDTDTATITIELFEAVPTSPQALPMVGSTTATSGDINTQFQNGLRVLSGDDYLYYFNRDGTQDMVMYDLNGLAIDSIAPLRNIKTYGNIINDTLWFAAALDAASNLNRQVLWSLYGGADDLFKLNYGGNPWINARSFTQVGNSIFFAGKNPGSSNISRSKLLRLGPGRQLADLSIASDLNTNNHEFFNADGNNSLDHAFTDVGNGQYALYRATDGTSGYEYFVYKLSDSTASLLFDASATGDGAYALGGASDSTRLPLPVALTSGQVILPAFSDSSDVELWITDGTTPNTTQIANLNATGGINIPTTGLVSTGATAIFAADSGNGLDLWSSDGTAAGTMMLSDINMNASDSINHMTVNPGNGLVFFAATNGMAGREPWITDGTTAGTIMLGDLNPSGSSNPNHVFAAKDGFVFVANDGTKDLIYYTDGTTGGTTVLDTRTTYFGYGNGDEFLAVSDEFAYFGDTTGAIYRVFLPEQIPNDPPTIADETFDVAQDTGGGTVIGAMTASDPNGQALNFAILSGNTDNDFTINGMTGEITISVGATLNAVTKPAYSLEIEVTDGELQDTAIATINVFIPNQAPTFDPTGNGPFDVKEDVVAGTSVGTLNATDPEGETLSFSITDGNADGNFDLNSMTGEITVAAGAALDFDITPIYTLSVEASDGQLADSIDITINILEVVSISNMLELASFSPNPANSGVTVIAPYSGEKVVILSTLEGKVLKRTTFNMDSQEINLDALSAGIYLLRLHTNEGQATWKLVKE